MITAWIVVTVVSKSSTSVLIDTFMTDWSSTITNWAVANATRGHHRFIDSPFLASTGPYRLVRGPEPRMPVTKRNRQA